MEEDPAICQLTRPWLAKFMVMTRQCEANQQRLWRCNHPRPAAARRMSEALDKVMPEVDIEVGEEAAATSVVGSDWKRN